MDSVALVLNALRIVQLLLLVTAIGSCRLVQLFRIAEVRVAREIPIASHLGHCLCLGDLLVG